MNPDGKDDSMRQQEEAQPDSEQDLRLKLRHVRRAQHELYLACEIALLLTEEMADCRDRLTDYARIIEAALDAMRGLSP